MRKNSVNLSNIRINHLALAKSFPNATIPTCTIPSCALLNFNTPDSFGDALRETRVAVVPSLYAKFSRIHEQGKRRRKESLIR